MDELHGKRRRQRAALELPQDRCRGFHRTVGQLQQSVGKRISLLPCGPVMHNALRQAAQVFHQNNAHRDRYRPKLADSQWLDALVSTHEAAQYFRVKPAVGVGNKRPRQTIDAGKSLEWTVGQLGQASIVTGWKVVMNFAQLFVDNVVIVDEPFRRRRDGALLTHRPGNGAIRFKQHAAIVDHARQERTPLARSLRHTLRQCEGFGVLLETLGAEQFGPNGIFESRQGNGL